MQVLFVNHYAGVFGGVEGYMRWAARGLIERGHQCALARVTDVGPDPDRYVADFSADYRIGGPAELAPLVRQIRPDVVFLHKMAGTASFLADRGSQRWVRYVHDHDLCCPRRHKYFALNGAICDRPASWWCVFDAGFIERRGGFVGLKSPTQFFGELEANRCLDRLLVGSNAMRAELVANGFDPARIGLVPPIPPPYAPPVAVDGDFAAAASAIVPTGRYLLYVGQLIRGKGVDVLIDAFASLTARFRDLSLVIAGAGNAESALRRQAHRLQVDATVMFAGLLQQPQLDALYRAAAMVVVPSRWPEPFGMVGIEAMQRGRPVVASAAGGIADWLDDGVTGLLCRPNDPRSLATAIRCLLDEPAIATAMGNAATVAAERRFDHQTTMDLLERNLMGEE